MVSEMCMQLNPKIINNKTRGKPWVQTVVVHEKPFVNHYVTIEIARMIFLNVEWKSDVIV